MIPVANEIQIRTDAADHALCQSPWCHHGDTVTDTILDATDSTEGQWDAVYELVRGEVDG